jgi:hypothetical protein
VYHPEPAILSATWDRSAYAMEARILGLCFGFAVLLECRFEARHYYRKAALFDRLLAFDIKMDFAKGPRH